MNRNQNGGITRDAILTEELHSKTNYLKIAAAGGTMPAVLWFSPPGTEDFIVPLLSLIPLIMGLRYGFRGGAVSALVLLGAMGIVVSHRPELYSDFLKSEAITLLAIGLITGEAKDIWRAEIRQLQGTVDYQKARFSQFAAKYKVLDLSHKKLEQQVGGCGNSLRSSLQRLQDVAVAHSENSESLFTNVGEVLLDIVSEAGEVYVAALYRVNERRMLQFPLVAALGRPSPLSMFNPLVRDTLRTGRVTTIRMSSEKAEPDLIAVIPLIDSTDTMYGVIAIHSMAFLSINESIFEMLALLGTHTGDMLASRSREVHECDHSDEFVEVIQRTLTRAERHRLPVSVIAIRITSREHKDHLQQICCQTGRGLDMSWVLSGKSEKPLIVKILPLTDSDGADSYVASLTERITTAGGSAAASLQLSRWSLVCHQSAEELASQIIAACHADLQVDNRADVDTPAPEATA